MCLIYKVSFIERTCALGKHTVYRAWSDLFFHTLTADLGTLLASQVDMSTIMQPYNSKNVGQGNIQ